jgi:hypothetical protein
MELKDFVREALLDVVAGVKAAKEDSKVGSLVAPRAAGHQVFPTTSGVVGTGPYFTTVKFHVALTVSEKGVGSGGGGIKLAVFNANVGGSTESLDETVSSIEFAVPLQMPD